MNTYEKHRGGGLLWLTRIPMKGFCPERPSGAKDLTSHPNKEFYPAYPDTAGEESATIEDSDPLGTPVTRPLSFHALANCSFRNFFLFIFIQNDGGVYPPAPTRSEPNTITPLE